jgi:hypothetical protein
MTRQELIKQCRYYKGEDTPVGHIGSMFCDYEEKWISFTLNDQAYIQELYRDYFERMGEYYQEDGTPDTLKAVLFNRYTHWNPYWTPQGFIDWYKSEYLKEH